MSPLAAWTLPPGDYILHTILNNYSRDATVILSTHLIGDIEPVLDEAIFLKDGRVFAHRTWKSCARPRA